MGKMFAVVGKSVCYFNTKLSQKHFWLLLFYWLRFLDDVFNKWPIQYNNQEFYKSSLSDEIHPDLQFTINELTTNISFLNIDLKIINNKLHFDVFHKSTNYFGYLYYKRSQPPHTKDSITFSLARSIVLIVTDKNNNLLQEVKICIRSTVNIELQNIEHLMAKNTS